MRCGISPRFPAAQATWILQSGPPADRPLAVLAQQWPQPRFLVAPETDVLAYVQPDAKPHLHPKYWCQADPDRVFDCVERGETLPNRYVF